MPQTGKLYLVATPIGNLSDITFRSLEVLREVDFIVCEDSRRSGVLLKHFEIKKPYRVLNDHTSPEKQTALLEEMRGGATAALISDAGTPLVSDPGFPLVRKAIEAGVGIEAVPGPTALVTALIVSGLPLHEFTFLGYLPPKEKKRRDALKSISSERRTLIFYESPHRILKALRDILEVLGDREISVSREMTKKFEETVRGKVSEVLARFEAGKILGEFVIVVGGG